MSVEFPCEKTMVLRAWDGGKKNAQTSDVRGVSMRENDGLAGFGVM